MSMSRLILWGGLFGLLIAGCMGARTVARTDKEEDEEPGKASLSEIQQVSGSDQQPFLVRLETSKGDLPLALGLGMVLLTLTLAINAVAFGASRIGARYAG